MRYGNVNFIMKIYVLGTSGSLCEHTEAML